MRLALSKDRFTYDEESKILFADLLEFDAIDLFQPLSNSADRGFPINFSGVIEEFKYLNEFYEDNVKAGFLYKSVNADLDLKVKIFR